jgi:hypothetical protein
MWWQHLIAEGFFVRDGNSFDGAAALLRTAPRVAPAFGRLNYHGQKPPRGKR